MFHKNTFVLHIIFSKINLREIFTKEIPLLKKLLRRFLINIQNYLEYKVDLTLVSLTLKINISLITMICLCNIIKM